MNRGILTHHSFSLGCNSPDGRLVTIKFRDNEEFNFTLLHPQSEANESPTWKTIESPGRYFISTDTYDHREFDQAFNSIYGWADRVSEEVVLGAKAHADKSLIEQLRFNIEQTADNLPEPDKPFTSEELDDWSDRFSRLLVRLSELEKANEIQNGRVAQLERELVAFKARGETIPKRTWLKTAGNKVIDLLDTTSKAALKSIAEGAVKAMLEHK